MPDLPLPRGLILQLLNELPTPPSALSQSDVITFIKFLLHSHGIEMPAGPEAIFEWLLAKGWMIPAEHLPKTASGRYHYYYRSEAGQKAIETNFLERRPQWV